MDNGERSKRAMVDALKLIGEAHNALSTLEEREIRLIASKIAQSRGLDPQAIVSFAPSTGTYALIDSSGAVAVAVIASEATWTPAWKLFEADARLARDVIQPPAPTLQQQQSSALGRALRQAGGADMRRQECDVD